MYTYAQEEKLRLGRRSKSKGSGYMLHQKILKFRVSEISSPVFSVKMQKENAVNSCLFYPSLVLSVGKVQCLREKRIKQ